MTMPFRKIITEKEHGFTLIELIVVIIIVGILAAIGMTQYGSIVEKSRTTEAKIRLGTMRQLAYEYYLNNGTLNGITSSDLGSDNTCVSTDFYKYALSSWNGTYATLTANRCTSGGKTPNASTAYNYFLRWYPATGQTEWCFYGDGGWAGCAPPPF